MANKLTAIVNMWDGSEFLPFLIPNLQKQVDGIIVVYSVNSNYGEPLNQHLIKYDKTKYINWEPRLRRPASENETVKRNVGLKAAIEGGATHVLMCDVDEFYYTDEFNAEKERLYSNGTIGYVCGLECFFKRPTLTIGIERTRLAFITKVYPGMQFGGFKSYPFAYDGKEAKIDPTRRLNVSRGIEWSDIIMYHYSHVRKDFMRKINNSTAKNNLLKSTILEDYMNAAPGYFCKYYQRELKEVENKFGIEI